MKLGIIGVGKMGYSIIHGITENKLYKKADILCYDHNEDKQLKLKELGYNIAKDECEVVENVDVVIFAIKPQNFKELLEKIKKIKNFPIVVSIAAGISSQFIMNILGDIKVIRAMPNTPLLISKGVTALTKTNNVNEIEFNQILNIFSSIGIVRELDENQIDDVIPANGSMPAFAYYFMKAFIDSSVKRGIEYSVAKEFVCESIIGSAHMILESEKSIDDLINDVCSKGGATIEGIKVFDNRDLNGIIDEASIKCVKRAKELNK